MNIKCALCGGPPPLLDGHIVPRWAAMNLRAEGEEPAPHLIAISNTGNTKRTPTGFYVEKWLCAPCEARTSVFEAAAKRAFVDMPEGWQPFSEQGRPLGWVRSDVGSYSLKMFFVQLLLKAHLAPHGFNVDLGPLADMAKRAVLGAQTLKPTEFPVFLGRYVDFDPRLGEFARSILLPTVGKFAGQTSYKIAISGFVAHVIASRRLGAKHLQSASLGEGDRTLSLAFPFGEKEMSPFRQLAEASNRLDRVRKGR